MGIFERMGQALSARFNSLLEAAEDPGKSLDLMLREMQEHVRAARRELVRALAAERQLAARATELDSELQRWVGRAELAVRSGAEDLAKSALLQRRRVANERARTQALQGEQRANVLELKLAFERMQQKIAELSARQNTIAVQSRLAQHGSGSLAEGLGAKAGSQPFEALRDMEDRIDNVDAVFEAQREVDAVLSSERGPGGMSAAEVESKFQELERAGHAPALPSAESSVDEDLAQLKKKIRIQT
jgi:phage shock protein A